MRSSLVVATLLAVSGLVSCGSAQRQTEPGVGERGLPHGTLSIERNGATILRLRVEIAETDESRTRGLMSVADLPLEWGMTFHFDSESRRSFWMKDTLIPLDIAFWDEGGRIVDILQMEPCTQDPCTFYTPQAEFIGAIEANRNILLGAVAVGDLVVLERSD